ncbi:hypothetical protein [Brachybacterium paraconglomeratum]|uniref:hypothetical protein n=1 Tax=Brachybacterium paraconglomeratum TaxID=173362 RepID=UPI0022B06411|nr:hypothetical protein [Brachybacterium paraconglomeratum]MCZ4326703.1 hypothetical protein [Brachybacterium paraconglomeratum]
MAQVREAEDGWSTTYGGPVGVAALCSALQIQLAEQSEAIAAVRVAAIRELLKDHSGVEVAAMFGVSKTAISKTNRARTWEDPTW